MNVTLAELVLDLRVRDTDPAAVTDYAEAMEAGVRFPPIMVFRYADGTLHLADGFHRAAAALRAGLTTLPALVQGGNRETALRYALGANRANGQRRTAQDIRQAVAIALKEWPSLTQAEVASLIGCNQATVSRVRADVMQLHNAEVPTVRVDSIGRAQPTVKPRAKPAPAPAAAPVSAPVAVAEETAAVVEVQAEQSGRRALRKVMEAIRELLENIALPDGQPAVWSNGDRHELHRDALKAIVDTIAKDYGVVSRLSVRTPVKRASS